MPANASPPLRIESALGNERREIYAGMGPPGARVRPRKPVPRAIIYGSRSDSLSLEFWAPRTSERPFPRVEPASPGVENSFEIVEIIDRYRADNSAVYG